MCDAERIEELERETEELRQERQRLMVLVHSVHALVAPEIQADS